MRVNVEMSVDIFWYLIKPSAMPMHCKTLIRDHTKGFNKVSSTAFDGAFDL